jgi:predicted transcriptional regulator
MPATSPRITVTITDELSVALKRLSQLTRQSQSSLVGELLAQSLPVFERMVQLMEAVSAINEKVDKSAKSIREGMDAAHSQLEATLMGLEALLPEGGAATRSGPAWYIRGNRSPRGGGATGRGHYPHV